MATWGLSLTYGAETYTIEIEAHDLESAITEARRLLAADEIIVKDEGSCAVYSTKVSVWRVVPMPSKEKRVIGAR
jgi:hypothetical protein